MVGVERRRVHTTSNAQGAGTQTSLIATVDESNAVNVHGLRISMGAEPENADANGNGHWTLWCLPRQTTAVPSSAEGALETEGDNPVMWATGVWFASNQTPWNHELSPKTSRNCPAGTRIVLQFSRDGVSAGNVQFRIVMTYFTRGL